MNTPVNFHTKRFKICFSVASLMHIVFGLIIFLNFKQNSEITSAQNNAEINSLKTINIPHAEPAKNINLPRKKPRTADVIIHEVKPGESFWKIANKYKIDIESILALNTLNSSHILKVGEKIKIPVNK